MRLGTPRDGKLEGLRALVRWSDDAITVPGTSFRIGLDGLLGLIPGVGDLAGGLVSGWFILVAARLGAPAWVLARMGLNAWLDALIGAVPLLGDLFDLAWKANRRNLALLEHHLADPVAARRSSRAVVAATVVGVLALLALAVAGAVAVAGALLRWVAG